MERENGARKQAGGRAARSGGGRGLSAERGTDGIGEGPGRTWRRKEREIRTRASGRLPLQQRRSAGYGAAESASAGDMHTVAERGHGNFAQCGEFLVIQRYVSHGGDSVEKNVFLRSQYIWDFLPILLLQ